ncbi:uncharacterized protein DDB_G0271670-like isoform X3 [Mercenaria mercenaria]|uniref:uncharacterized protein DDB_G0271670-like isoform X3 n=1 Tax=Mercenaria mercenaria TaxID=6596 RepID=UPI00234E38EA|nr:uncharacterized protein DDB_G0271670-like isoform X3 [Mercenaria mercenaria]
MIYIYLCVLLSVSMNLVLCDYKCLCNYNVEKPIYDTSSTTGDVIGYMYEFDCKPTAGDSGTNGWLAVAFENKLGFAQNDAQLQIQTCPGSIPDEDKLPTKPTPISSTTTFHTTSTEGTTTTTTILTTNSTTNLSSAHLTNNLTTAGIPSVTVPESTITSFMNSTSPITISSPSSTTNVPASTRKEQTALFSTSHPTTIVATTATPLTTATFTNTSTASTTAPTSTTATTVIIATASTISRTFANSTTSTTAPNVTSSATSTYAIASTTSTTATTSTLSTTATTSIPSTAATPSTDAITSTTTTASTTSTTSTSASTSTPFTTATTPTTVTKNWHPTSGLTEMCPSTVKVEAQRNGIQLAQFGKKCYEIIQTKMSWAKAEIACRGKGGHLADIGSQQEQDFLYHFLEGIKSHTVWLGLHDRNEEEKFEWTSGSPVVYTYWKHDRKDGFYHNKQDCVYMTANGTWDDIYCGSDGVSTTYLHAYVCQYSLIGLCPYSVQLEAQRGDIQLTQFGNKCYESVQTKMSWAKAETTCQGKRGHLADISSQQEQDFLYHFLESIKSHTVWLGLHDRNEEERFEWTSGNPVVYTNWKNDRKDAFYHNKHDCVYMTVNGTWDDINCGFDGVSSTYVHAYVCQYSKYSHNLSA